jgi:sodium transport system permease protein
MNLSNVRLIMNREVRDQLRDRRTLFMIFVLPILLYPLLGLSMFQVVQFVSEHATRVLVIGSERLPPSPALLDGNRFASRWFGDPERNRLLELEFQPEKPGVDEPSSEDRLATARHQVQNGEYEAVIYFPADFNDRLQIFQTELDKRADGHANDLKVPSPEIFYNTAREKSQVTFFRISQVLDRWTNEIGRQNLVRHHLPESAARPFAYKEQDVAGEGHRDAALWSKLLPFMLLLWALTGAFYPAVDLCAGEKERGTLETLLTSPAARSEIVWGKLLTVMLFSMGTAILNLLSMGITGSFVMAQIAAVSNLGAEAQIGAPPLLAPLWLLIALLPVSALFSALCLALAAFARSSKEGQYYLMPLVMITMPLVILPMAPGVELTLGNSLIPVTGIVLLLRSMLEGNYAQALPFIPPVALVTLGCCLMAVRWAVDQFNSESVLFREGERLDIGLWLKQLLRDREDTPSAAEALLCGVLILMVGFFMNLLIAKQDLSANPVALAAISQLVVIATPALLMTIMLTRSPRKTLLLNRPPLLSIPAAALLALAAHPIVGLLNAGVQKLYPVNSNLEKAISNLMGNLPSFWVAMLLLAVLPAICEELAYRGFILSGLRHLGHKWRAIAISSFFFGVTHGILQQSIVAFVVGLMLGYLAVQSGSILPGIVYHLVHNTSIIACKWASQSVFTEDPILKLIFEPTPDGSFVCTWQAIAVGGLLMVLILGWFRSLPYRRTPEESLQESISQHAAVSA